MLVRAHLTADREPRDTGARHAQDLPAILERIGVLQMVRLGHATILQCDEPVLHDAQRNLLLIFSTEKSGLSFVTTKPLTWSELHRVPR